MHPAKGRSFYDLEFDKVLFENALNNFPMKVIKYAYNICTFELL